MPTQPDYVRISDAYAAAIVSGRLKPGEKLPSIAEMSKRYTVGATTIKMVLVRLEARRLVRRHQGKGTFVEPSDRWLLPDGDDDDEPDFEI
ncbi:MULTISPECIES: winged helix-turn-helix domain-containing protein [Micromonosporaceae]|uniref:winged helix-turn-helix domain-containing protein n=1 Tax=Micromonosporaceae TaxID=28056 RepID=UPI00248B05EC|nr:MULTISPECIES: winged helix-turn-helix domain-containing protein [unclassified Solwaraspora]WBB95599.1 winged helix-turn-helix domain-containing protein [Solwaraspora sp. WMMA2059]WBC20496.1 winged helix-turn-helix domain-containing protein [Solwaraspora sp. WMMA2080]